MLIFTEDLNFYFKKDLKVHTSVKLNTYTNESYLIIYCHLLLLFKIRRSRHYLQKRLASQHNFSKSALKAFEVSHILDSLNSEENQNYSMCTSECAV